MGYTVVGCAERATEGTIGRTAEEETVGSGVEIAVGVDEGSTVGAVVGLCVGLSVGTNVG